MPSNWVYGRIGSTDDSGAVAKENCLTVPRSTSRSAESLSSIAELMGGRGGRAAALLDEPNKGSGNVRWKELRCDARRGPNCLEDDEEEEPFDGDIRLSLVNIS